MKSGKLLILSLLVSAVAAWFALALGQYATLDYLTSSQQAFQHYYAQHPNAGYCAYVVAPKVEKFKRTFRARVKA